MIKILFVDDHTCFRESFVLALKKECPAFEFLEAGNGDSARKMLMQNTDCSILLLDLQVGTENGLAILTDLQNIQPDIRVLICTAFFEPLTIENVLKRNVQGFITKTSGLSEIVSALKTVAEGKEYFCSEALTVMKASVSRIPHGSDSAHDNTMELFSRYRTLTLKEKEIFEHLAEGLDAVQIAEKLGKSVKTVENQRSAVYVKMGIHDRLGAVDAGKLLGIRGF